MDFVAQKKLKKFVEIAASINSSCFDKNMLVRCILESAVRLVRCEHVLFWECDKNSTLRFISELGKKNEGVDFYSFCQKSAEISSQKKSYEISVISKYEVLSMPIFDETHCFGVLQFSKKNKSLNSKVVLENVWFLSHVSLPALKNIEQFENMQSQLAINEISFANNQKIFIAKSNIMKDLQEVVHEASQVDVPVLFLGECGTGKKTLAEQMHYKSKRANKNFIKINCASLSEALSHSAFTNLRELEINSCDETKKSLSKLFYAIKYASGGTIFFDEVANLSDIAQKFVLSVFENDVRIVASSSHDLSMLVEQKKFESTLYRKLATLQIKVPPLRAHKDDILLLADFFLRKYSSCTNKKFTNFSLSAQKKLLDCKWRSNIRELKNVVEKACMIGTPPLIHAHDLYNQNSTNLLQNSQENVMLKDAVDEFKKNYIINILEKTNWNQTLTAKILGIQRTYLSRLIKELEIRQ